MYYHKKEDSQSSLHINTMELTTMLTPFWNSTNCVGTNSSVTHYLKLRHILSFSNILITVTDMIFPSLTV